MKKETGGFEKLFYGGKEVKLKKPKWQEFWLEMPKKPVGVKTVFTIAFGYKERTHIVVDNDPRIKQIKVIAKL